MARSTIARGLVELDDEPLEPGRVRAEGGGRKRAVELDPGLSDELDRLVDPDSRGDPMSPLRWTTKSTRQLAEALSGQGHETSHTRVAELLRSALHTMGNAAIGVGLGLSVLGIAFVVSQFATGKGSVAGSPSSPPG